ncbi:cupin domain-containing protein [Micromonospora sp. NPDC047812]|uniref:JmjC domain-containing protein n=1 Tax=Micromonospora sp. NPDC047812 TaxID=3155742 RepID=UPI0034558BFD
MATLRGFDLLTTEDSMIDAAWGSRTSPMAVAPSFLASIDQITIDRLLEERSLRPPYVSFAREGRQLPDHEVTIGGTPSAAGHSGLLDRAKARSLVADGATVMFYQAHHWIDSLGTIAERISSALRARCGATVFHTPADSPGLAWHRDAQHVFAVQLAGAKEWRVERNAPSGWWSSGALVEGPGTDVGHVILRCGEALYMPPGVAHTARATDEPSTHVSFVVEEPETKDLLLAMFERAAQGVRTRLAAGPVAERSARAATIAREFVSAVRELDTGEVLRMVEEDAMETGWPPSR